MVLDKHLPQQEILFDVKETEVIVQHKATSKVLFHYCYTDISCVGRRLDSHNLFAFCSLASPDSPEDSTFDCLVFESNSEEESEEIIKRIAMRFFDSTSRGGAFPSSFSSQLFTWSFATSGFTGSLLGTGHFSSLF
ncbi:hypothetical protein E2320_015781 [Naja naja]|nr:hypothetical protein E2320_015781 [Naja naja]